MYVDVVIPLAINDTLTYSVPQAMIDEVKIGERVLVHVGKKKIYTGIILRINNNADTSRQYKEIICILDSSPIITLMQLQLWQWIAEYYMCTLGEVMKAALPTALKLESETKVRLTSDIDDYDTLTSTQLKIIDFLDDKKYKTLDEINRYLGVTSAIKQVQQLLNNGFIEMEETVDEKYKLRTENYISLTQDYTDENKLQEYLNHTKSEKHRKLIYTYLKLTDIDHIHLSDTKPVNKKLLSKESGISNAIINLLVEKGVFQQSRQAISRLNTYSSQTIEKHELNLYQQTAVKQIYEHWNDKNIVLLNGVTSSGKTEIYINLIQDTIKKGGQVLYLVPEIALTTQLTTRLQRVFGDRLGVYHSKFNDAERAEIYYNILKNDKYDIILGVRSSVLLPFRKLDLIIVDEEHEPSYKQHDPAPRYNARNAALMLARFSNSKSLLGSATPSIESYYYAQKGIYGLVKLEKRYKDIQMPKINIIDLQQQYHRKEMTGHFSDALTKKISDELNKNKQTIVFQNRRGYARYVECKSCAYIPKCINCDVSLTLHQNQNTLVCHYCGYTISVPQQCPACGEKNLTDRGMGTEKVEEELSKLFPNAKIGRMDLDTTRNKRGYEQLLNSFSSHELDILVGTQMVSKGLDFDDVSTVAVLDADGIINQPDFRSSERAFQLLEQVSGRAGRKGEQGEVIIQTRNTENSIIRYVEKHDYEAFYKEQIAERELFKYPPFYRIIFITVKHKDIHQADEVAKSLQGRLKTVFTHRCSRVVIPYIAKVQNLFLRQIMLKIESNASYSKAKQLLKAQIEDIKQTPFGKSAQIIIDIDPN